MNSTAARLILQRLTWLGCLLVTVAITVAFMELFRPAELVFALFVLAFCVDRLAS